jgi:hypothetical protein
LPIDITVSSTNIGSINTHLDQLLSFNHHLLFTQESNLPEYSFTDFQHSLDHTPHKPILAAPCPVDHVTQRPTHKGVTTLAHRSLAISQPNTDTFNEHITSLYKEGRFQHTQIHPGSQRQPISFINFYGFSTSNTNASARLVERGTVVGRGHAARRRCGGQPDTALNPSKQ